MEKQSNVLIILGMHRSGTSLTAQWINSLGINLGDQLLKGDFSNSKGHYEDLDFLNLHKDILSYNNEDITGLDLTSEKLNVNSYFKEKAKSLIYLKNNLRNEWGWKEPRTCLLMDIYQEILPNAKFLIVYRSCNEVSSSLKRREIKKHQMEYKNLSHYNKLKQWHKYQHLYKSIDKDEKQHIKHWEIYNSNLIDFIKKTDDENFTVINLESLMKYDSMVFKQLKKWGFHIQYKPFSEIYDQKLFNPTTSSEVVSSEISTFFNLHIEKCREKLL